MLAKKKKDGGYLPGSSRNGAVPKSEKPCFQFQNAGACRFGGKCKFSHDGVARGGNKDQSSKKLPTCQKNDAKAPVASGVKKALQKIAKKRKIDEISEDDTNLGAIIASCLLSHTTQPIPRAVSGSEYGVSLGRKGSAPALAVQLHSCEENTGADSGACFPISCFRSDFLFLGKSASAIASVSPPAGINGGTPEVGGIGPMLVYLVPNDNPHFCFQVLAMQKLKALGVRMVGCHRGDTDVPMDRRSRHDIELAEEGPPNKKVLVMETQPIHPMPHSRNIKELVKDAESGKRTAMITEFNVDELKANHPRYSGVSMLFAFLSVVTALLALLSTTTMDSLRTTTMVLSEAKLSIVERSRLY